MTSSADLWKAFVRKVKDTASEHELLIMRKADFAACVKRAQVSPVDAARLEMQWQVYQTSHPICKRRYITNPRSPGAKGRPSKVDVQHKKRVEELWAKEYARRGELAERLAGAVDMAERLQIEDDERRWQREYLRDLHAAEAQCPPALLERLRLESPYSPLARESPATVSTTRSSVPDTDRAPPPALPDVGDASPQPLPRSAVDHVEPVVDAAPAWSPANEPTAAPPDPAVSAAAAMAAAHAAARVDFPLPLGAHAGVPLQPVAQVVPVPDAVHAPSPLPVHYLADVPPPGVPVPVQVPVVAPLAPLLRVAAGAPGLFGMHDEEWEAEVAALRLCEEEHMEELLRRRAAAAAAAAPEPWESAEVLEAWHCEWEAQFSLRVRDLQQRRYPYMVPQDLAAVAPGDVKAQVALRARVAADLTRARTEPAAAAPSSAEPAPEAAAAASRGVTAILSPSRTPTCSEDPASVKRTPNTAASPSPAHPSYTHSPATPDAHDADARPAQEPFAVPIVKPKPKLGARTRLAPDGLTAAGADPGSCTRHAHNKARGEGLRAVHPHHWAETTQPTTERNERKKHFPDSHVRNADPCSMTTPDKSRPYRSSIAHAHQSSPAGGNPCDMAQPVFASSPAGHMTGRRTKEFDKTGLSNSNDPYLCVTSKAGAADTRRETRRAPPQSTAPAPGFHPRGREDFEYLKGTSIANRNRGVRSHTPPSGCNPNTINPASPSTARGRARGAPKRDSGVMPGAAGW